jgi:large subunit ribosomal protein L21
VSCALESAGQSIALTPWWKYRNQTSFFEAFASVGRRLRLKVLPDWAIEHRGMGMYAVIRTGGKQYRISEGDVLRIEKLTGDVGSEITFADVLLLSGDSPKIGQPLVSGAKVMAKIVAQDKHRRVVHFRKEKEGWTRARGHRQPYTEVKITSISG